MYLETVSLNPQPQPNPNTPKSKSGKPPNYTNIMISLRTMFSSYDHDGYHQNATKSNIRKQSRYNLRLFILNINL